MLCAACGEALDTVSAACPACGTDPLLDGRYALERVVGQGGAGTTYRASGAAGAPVALKELPLSRALTPKARQLIEREAPVLRQLKHPAIPRFVESFSTGAGKRRILYVVQEFIEGQSLEAILAEHRFSFPEVLDLMEELLEVLSYLHTLAPPVIHRDIKPANIIWRPSGALGLVDFGSVRDALRGAELGGSTVAGTFGYMAPEQFMGDAWPATDLYGLGATAIRLLTRMEPHTLLDHQNRMNWEPHVQVHPAGVRFLRALLQADLRRRVPDARSALAELQSVRQARLRSPRLGAPGPGRVVGGPGAARSAPPAPAATPAERSIWQPSPAMLPARREGADAAHASHASPGPLELLPARLLRFSLPLMALISAVFITLWGTRGAWMSAPAVPVEVAPAPASPDEAGYEMASAYASDVYVQSCLKSWRDRSRGEEPSDAALPLAVQKLPWGEPEILISRAEGMDGGLIRCLIEAADAIRWPPSGRADTILRRFALPLWDAPLPLKPWPASSSWPVFTEDGADPPGGGGEGTSR